jgi:FkbM family methyltransferase
MDVKVRAQSFAVRVDTFAAFWARVAAGDWEPDSFAVIERFVVPGTTFVDIGAWIGPLTLYAASVAGAVHAIEPDPVARAVLQANIGLNPRLAERIQVHAVAVGAKTGSARLGNITSACGGDSMSSLLYADAPVSWAVDCTTLDRFLTAVDGPVPSLIKIDTEGTEVELLDAARDWLAATRPPLLLSVHARFWPDPYPPLTRLAELLSGYRELLTPWFSPLDPQTLLDDEHAHGVFELVAM